MPIQDDIPRSRITLTYRTTITGEPEDVELPLRLLMLGDLSQKPEKGDLEDRDIHTLNGSNLDEVMRSMDLDFEVEIPTMSGDGAQTIEIPVTGMRSFSPDAIAEQIPAVRSLKLMRALLVELQANIANQRRFRKELQQLFRDQKAPELVSDLMGGGFKVFQLPDANGASEAAPSDAPAAPPKGDLKGDAPPKAKK